MEPVGHNGQKHPTALICLPILLGISCGADDGVRAIPAVLAMALTLPVRNGGLITFCFGATGRRRVPRTGQHRGLCRDRVERLGRYRDGTKVHGECLGVEPCTRAFPEEQRELKHAVGRPQRHQPDQAL
jgi:hypothetical protein